MTTLSITDIEVYTTRMQGNLPKLGIPCTNASGSFNVVPLRQGPLPVGQSAIASTSISGMQSSRSLFGQFLKIAPCQRVG